MHYSGRVGLARALRGDRIINKPIVTVHRRLVAMLCSVAALLMAGAAQAECPRADLGGGGIRDRIELSRGSELAFPFSTMRRWERLHAGDLVIKFVVTDVDRDGDPDLVASTRKSGLRVWINRGRGLFFSPRSRQLKTRRFHLVTHRFGHSVRGVQSIRWDDSVLNDPTRLFIVWSAPPRAHLVAVCRAPAPACAAVPSLAGHRPTPRGPPLVFS